MIISGMVRHKFCLHSWIFEWWTDAQIKTYWQCRWFSFVSYICKKIQGQMQNQSRSIYRIYLRITPQTSVKSYFGKFSRSLCLLFVSNWDIYALNLEIFNLESKQEFRSSCNIDVKINENLGYILWKKISWPEIHGFLWSIDNQFKETFQYTCEHSGYIFLKSNKHGINNFIISQFDITVIIRSNLKATKSA